MFRQESVAPSYERLKPLKPSTTPNLFPVYPDLVDVLATAEEHPNNEAAYALSVCAGYAYATADDVSMLMARMGLVDNACRMIGFYVDPMFISSTAFLVQSSDGRVVILAYRGTEPINFINWLTDADVHPDKVAIPFETPPGTFEVHGGFYRNVRATRSEVVTALQRAVEGQSILEDTEPSRAPTSPLEALYITGHSLGGAMSALMAVMLVTDGGYSSIASKLRAVYTFGQPMIGSPELAAACEADPDLRGRLFRYVYRQDLVPRLPPRDTGRFAHSGPSTGTTIPGRGSTALGRRRNSGTPRRSSKPPSRPSRSSSRCSATSRSGTASTTTSRTTTCRRSPHRGCPPSSATTTSRRNDERHHQALTTPEGPYG